MRREKRQDPTLAQILARDKARRDCKNPTLRDKFAAEARIQDRALELYDTYHTAGVEWAACVQAVKTNWVSQFQEKWGDRLRALKSATKTK